MIAESGCTIRVAALAVLMAVAGRAEQKVDFARDVEPLLFARCAGCHMGDKREGGLSLHTHADILKGGRNGPAVVPGSSKDSLLIQHVTGFTPPVMPFGGPPLSDREINLLRDWVDQGASGVDKSAAPQAASRLAPRRPEVPAAQFADPIDSFVQAYLRRHDMEMPQPVLDGVFLRRAYLDLWGLPPTIEERDEFLHDRNPDKRERLINRLLSHKKNYAEHWISYWNDLLRNDEGVIYHGARQSITPWLLKALEENLPYDRFVTALLDPLGPDDPAGFLIGVNWRGTVSASQTPVMQAAQNSAQVFLGVNLKCNSCHDSFISRWKLKDAYGMAALFSEEELEMYRCDVKTGQNATPKFLFPELGRVVPNATPAERRATAARLFTTPENGRFARTLVNRYWKRLLGRGLVEPVDDMDGEGWDSDLLDWLAADFVEHQYDLKFLLRRIMTSQAYQLPAVRLAAKEDKGYTFRGPVYRRLTAEQFVDSISSITGEWRVLEPEKAGVGAYSREWRLKSTALTRALGRPIRDQVFTERNQDPTTLQALELVNGETLARLLRRGAQRMLGEMKPPPANLFDSGIVRAEMVPVDIDITGARELRLLIEDADSYDRNRVIAGWANAELEGPSGVTRLVERAVKPKVEKRPLRINKEDFPEAVVAPVPAEIIYDIAGKGYTRFRAVAGVDESCLQNDISPRIRFFVFTGEPDREHLVRLAAEGAGTGAPDKDTDSLITRIYRQALGRDPGPEEKRVAQEFLGVSGAAAEISAKGLEDLLWSVFLSPEFQYIN
ncbi:MAG: DUF1549 domain-containing protein [Acidobacteria bacterium]|nr:DUF1549 domain-containing protein [Acidobacteriota bacterium]